MENYDHNNAEHRMTLALDFVTRMGADESDFDRAAHQYQVDRETLVAQYDWRTRQWAASRGYDF